MYQEINLTLSKYHLQLNMMKMLLEFLQDKSSQNLKVALLDPTNLDCILCMYLLMTILLYHHKLKYL